MKTEEPPSLEDWFNGIISLHGKPVLILLSIDADGMPHLLAASGSGEQLNFIYDRRMFG